MVAAAVRFFSQRPLVVATGRGCRRRWVDEAPRLEVGGVKVDRDGEDRVREVFECYLCSRSYFFIYNFRVVSRRAGGACGKDRGGGGRGRGGGAG